MLVLLLNYYHYVLVVCLVGGMVGVGGKCNETGREGEAEDEFVCTDILVILLYNYQQQFYFYF